MNKMIALGLLATLLNGCADPAPTAGEELSADRSAAAAAAMMGYHGPLRREDRRDEENRDGN